MQNMCVLSRTAWCSSTCVRRSDVPLRQHKPSRSFQVILSFLYRESLPFPLLSVRPQTTIRLRYPLSNPRMHAHIFRTLLSAAAAAALLASTVNAAVCRFGPVKSLPVRQAFSSRHIDRAPSDKLSREVIKVEPEWRVSKICSSPIS